MRTIYCPTDRSTSPSDDTNPPYSAICSPEGHLHPITRTECKPFEPINLEPALKETETWDDD